MKRDEAIKVASEMYGWLKTDREKEALESLIPELKETENERIRNRIRLCLDECVHSDIIRDYERDECLDYIEKLKGETLRDFIDDFPYSDEQKEQKDNKFAPRVLQCSAAWFEDGDEKQEEQSITANDLDKEIKRFFDDCIDVHEAKLYGSISERVIPVDCYEITARHFAKWGERQKEKKPIRDIVSGDAIESCMLRYLQSAANRKDDIEIIEDTKAYKSELISIIEKEWKPADEQFPPLEGLDKIKAKYYDYGFKNGFDEGVESVKSTEWSEEDKQNLSVCLTYIKDTQLRDWLIGVFHKSSKWSEEDEENFKWFDKFFRAESVIAGGRDIPQDKYLWFKSLPKRFSPQPNLEVEGDNETEIQKAYREGKNAGRKEVFDHPEYYGLQLRRMYDYKTGKRNPEWSEKDKEKGE